MYVTLVEASQICPFAFQFLPWSSTQCPNLGLHRGACLFGKILKFVLLCVWLYHCLSQLTINIRGKGLDILPPALRPCSPHVSTLCLPAAMHVIRSSRPSPAFCIHLHNYDQRLVFTKAWEHDIVHLLHKGGCCSQQKFTSQRIQASTVSKQPAFLEMWEQLHITASADTISMQLLRTALTHTWCNIRLRLSVHPI